MDAKDIIAEHLDRIADLLEPFTREVSPGSLIWNGSEYRPAQKEQRADPEARMWYGMLVVTAGLLRRQMSELSESQVAYLKKMFVGGVGSLLDLNLLVEHTNALSTDINDKFEAECAVLFDILNRLCLSSL